ncbi:MAG: alpha-amylase family glycosyl hydrolase [Planctomycetota bacterium]
MSSSAGEHRAGSGDSGPTPLGVTYTPGHSRFAVVAEAEAVRVRLVHPGTKDLVVRDLEPVAGERLVWACDIDGDWAGWSYGYELEREGRWIVDILDPRAKVVRGTRGFVCGPICAEKHPVVARPTLDPCDAVIYELHVRDFTRDPQCGVKPDWRGRYPGLAQRGTMLEGTSFSTCLDHIIELGVNTVQLMPVHSFALPYNPEYEWGYMPNEFFAPHAGYAAGVKTLAPLEEFRDMVSALHKAGLRVTVDVVFNHTDEDWPHGLRNFMALAPREYYRFRDDGRPYDGSACGNEFRSDSEHGRRYIVEACEYWVREFGVDGYRFDLMGLIDEQTMREVARRVHAVDPTIMVYGEPWAAGETPIEINRKGVQRSKGWGVFNDEIRDALRGEVFEEDDPGFLIDGRHVEALKRGVEGSIHSFADSPAEVINYIECHDNHTLMDRLELVHKRKKRKASDATLEQMHRLGALILLTSQGVPFLHSGQEFGRSKFGFDNTYNLGDTINNIRWRDKAEREELYEFHRQCIAMRVQHPMFRLRTRLEIESAVSFLGSGEGEPKMPAGVLGARVDDPTGTDPWSSALLLFNGSARAASVVLPEGDWWVRVRDSVFDDSGARAEGSLALAAHGGSVLFRAAGR